jgi:hypothetical protein
MDSWRANRVLGFYPRGGIATGLMRYRDMTDEELVRYIDQRCEMLVVKARRAGLTTNDEIVRYMRDSLEIYETFEEVSSHPNWRKVLEQKTIRDEQRLAKLNAN